MLSAQYSASKASGSARSPVTVEKTGIAGGCGAIRDKAVTSSGRTGSIAGEWKA